MKGLETKNLSASYDGQIALGKTNFSLAEGRVAAIIGPSGCGKSTLLKAIAGLIPYEGEIFLDERPLDPQRQKIGFMPQDYGLLPWQTVRENILLPQRIRRHQETTEGKLNYWLERLGLVGLAERYPRELSGGERQRVALARTFLFEPDILLMDEPFSALDAITRENMQEIFLSLWRENSVTTLLVTHYAEEALYLSHKIILMSWGGEIKKIMDNPVFGTSHLADGGSALQRNLKQRIKEMGTKP